MCRSLLAAVVLLSLAGTGQADESGADFYERRIRPLLAAKCYACHSEREEEAEGGLQLDTPAAWRRGGDSGEAIVPGDIDASLLIRAVEYQDLDLQMPPTAPLAAASVQLLKEWVRRGAPGPHPGRHQGNVDPLIDPSDPVAGKQHWAFQPLGNSSPPSVRDVAWPRTGVDNFVLAKLEQQGLAPVARATRRQLVRRVYFALTGLPPNSQQVRDFVREPGQQSLERLVDRLLASPQFGERWGRHWLDLARYADSNGLDENFLFREAWRYRNWVISAVNADLPYDRFLLEQLAGDELPYASIAQRDRQRIAAGFLVVGPKVLLGNDKKKQRMEVADEQIDTIGRAILGQTLGCARCHDHKFDPFPTRDYYALAGIFAATQVMEQRYMLNQQRYMERLVGLGAEGEQADDQYETYWRELPALKQRLTRAQEVLDFLKNGNEAAVQAIEEDLAVAPDARKLELPRADRVAAQQRLLNQLTQAAKPPAVPPRAMVPTNLAEPADQNVRIAGQFDQLGEEVPRGFLQVLCGDEASIVERDRSGRVELAKWLTDSDGPAGRLAARVFANRVWQNLLGQGIVATPDNFGRTGSPPTHPELLDFLAARLIDSGWSLKALVRQIVLSETFALGSANDPSNNAADPGNQLLWRFHRRRLEPESLRDAMLAAAGELDLNAMDSTVWYLQDQATAVGANKVRRRTDFPCRSVYLPVIRNDLPELFEVFDFADPHVATGKRPKTTVATQGLFMMNDELVMSAASAAARRILETGADSVERQVEVMFDRILGTRPTPDELQSLSTFLETTRDFLRAEHAEEADVRALAMACHALFASSRFQYLE